MTSPVAYLQTSLAMTSMMVAVIFLLAFRSLGHKPHVRNWSIAFWLLTVQWLCYLASSWFPNFASFWLTVNALNFAAITLALRGHCQRTNCQYLPGNLWYYCAALYAGVVWTTLVQPHAGLSVAIFNCVSAVTILMSATMILRHRDHTRPAEWAAAITMIAFAFAQIAVAGFAVGLGAEPASVYQALSAHPIFYALPAGFIGMTMFVIFMLASDVSEEMKEIAVRDQLTGVLNRRGFGEEAAKAYATARRSGRPVSVIMTDIDHFKDVNDEFGHATGDAALAHFSALLSNGRRIDDVVARVGGEEFAIVLPGTDIKECITIAEDLCGRLEAMPLVVDGSSVLMTASFGVATISINDTCLTDVIVRADRALYRSKRAGRNRVDLESSQLMRTVDGSLESVST